MKTTNAEFTREQLRQELVKRVQTKVYELTTNKKDARAHNTDIFLSYIRAFAVDGCEEFVTLAEELASIETMVQLGFFLVKNHLALSVQSVPAFEMIEENISLQQVSNL